MKLFTCKPAVVLLFLGLLIGNSFAQTDWTDYLENPILSPGLAPNWDEWFVVRPFVIHYDNQFIMYYSGRAPSGVPESRYSTAIGMATSNDGINWIKYEQNPIISLGSSGEWDDTNIWSGPVLFDSSGYKMWYNGFNGDIERIGLATSEDGVYWEKYAGNPVLDIGESGQWDEWHVVLGSVIYQDSLYKMWYAGWGETWSFGYATSPDGFDWTKYEENPVLELVDYDEWLTDGEKVHGYVLFNGVKYSIFAFEIC